MPVYDERARSKRNGKAREVARRVHYDDYPESNEELGQKNAKSKSMSKYDSKSKQKKSKRRESSDEEEDSDNEEIVTKRKRYEELDIDQLPTVYRRAIKDIFGITDRKLDSYCHDGLIRGDTKDRTIDVAKILNKAEPNEVEAWEKFEKKYKKFAKEAEEETRGDGYYGGSSSYGGDNMVYYYD